jgi:hypothetical protein
VDALECRTVDVLPPSASGEGRLVFQAMGAIVFGALVVVGLHGAQDAGTAPGLAPFQILFRDAAPGVQRLLRETQEGLTEAERVRAASGQWPSPAVLAAQAIPPFADATPPYAWRLARDGRTLAYVGVPSSAGRADTPSLLAVIQEPEPGYSETVPLNAPPDETHHRLADGTLLHVTVWFRADGADLRDNAVMTQPFAAGWTQVLAGTQGR